MAGLEKQGRPFFLVTIMANEQNLIPTNKRTKSEQREIAQKGGKASGVSRRKMAAERELIRELAQRILDGKRIDPDTGEELTGRALLVQKLFDQVMKGNLAAIDKILVFAGEHPTINLDAVGARLVYEYQAGKRKLQDTVLEMTRRNITIPESLMALLKQAEPEPEQDTAYCIFDEAELERIARERTKNITGGKHTAWLAYRKAAVREMKEKSPDAWQ